MDPSTEPAPESSTPDSYDYPTEPIAVGPVTAAPVAAAPVAATAASSSSSASSVSWPTVLAAVGGAAIVAALVLSIGITGMLVSRDRTPATAAAPATVVQLGDTSPVAAPTTAGAAPTSDAPTADAPVADAPAADAPVAAAPAPQAPADEPADAPAAAGTTPPRATGDQSQPGNPNFKVTTDRPTLTDLTNIVNFLVATKASDEAKAANVEGGMSAVVVPKTVYTLGLFRPPLGWNKVTGPLVQNGNTVSATLNSGSAGRPTIRMTIQFKKIDGNWRLAASSMCEGVKTVGLNIYCNK